MEQITGRAYEDLCRLQIPSIWGHPSNFQHIASAEAFAVADMLAGLSIANIVATTRLMGAIPLSGLSASALDPLSVTQACLNELSVAFRDAYPWVGGFSEIVIKEVAGDEHDGKTGAFIRDAISGTKHTFAEWRQIAEGVRTEEKPIHLESGLYVVPHFHLLIAVMGQDGKWWTEAKIRQRLTDTICRERQASFPKRLGGRRWGGYTSTRGHVMSCIEYSIKRLNEMNDDELLLVSLWRAMSPNSGFINVVLSSTQTLPHQLVEFLDKRQAALARTLIEKNHYASAGSVEEIMAFLSTCPRLVSVSNTPSKTGTKPVGTQKMPVIGFIVGQVRSVFETVGTWLGKYWPPWSG